MKRTAGISAIAALLLTFSLPSWGQRWSVATNLLDYADFITLNLEVGASVHQHWTVSVKGRYNPFTFPTRLNGAGRIQNRTGSVSAGFKYWSFFVYSGFYYGGKVQWSRYNSIEFGIGLWFGGTRYRQYETTACGKLIDWGLKAFVAPNDVQINLLYTF